MTTTIELTEYQTDHLVDLVNRSFQSLYITPYPWQEDAVFLILQRFIYENKKNVILSADTGVGKSMIGAAVTIGMGIHLNIVDKPVSNIMMHQNMLVDQYAESLKTHDDFMRLKGASNYSCIYDENDTTITADDCKLPALRLEHKKNNGDSKMSLPLKCIACEYMQAVVKARTVPHIITNFQYHLAKTMKGGVTNNRPVAIFDEAQTLSDVAVDSMSIVLNDESFKQLNLAVKYAEKQCDMESNLDLVSKMAVLVDAIENSHNYFKDNGITELRFVAILESLIAALIPVVVEMQQDYIVANNYEGLLKAIKRLKNFLSIYQSYFNNKDKTEYVYDRNDEEKTYQIKPVFVKGLSEFILADYNLFMSATITDEYMIETIGLNKDETDFIILPSVYPKENKPIHCIARGSISASTLMNPNTLISLANDMTKIIRKHIAKKENGVAFTNSFKMAEDLYNLLPNDIKPHVILHRKGEKVIQSVMKLKNSNKPVILVSPSIFEGVDFKGDYSKYQILLKAPYPNLGDKRMSVIANRYGNIYKTITLMKIVQGIGRSVRGKTEVAETYILDSNIEKLLYSHLNVWRHTHTLKTGSI